MRVLCAAVALEGHGAGLESTKRVGTCPSLFTSTCWRPSSPSPALRLVIDRSACLLCSRTGRACLTFSGQGTDTSQTQRDNITVESVFEIGVDAFATVLRIDPPNYRPVSKDWKVEEDKEELMASSGFQYWQIFRTQLEQYNFGTPKHSINLLSGLG